MIPVEPAPEAPERAVLWRLAAHWRRAVHDPDADIVERAEAAAKLADVVKLMALRPAGIGRTNEHDDD